MAQTAFRAYRCIVVSTIVVGYDGAERSNRALERAIDEARKDRAQLVVVAYESGLVVAGT